MRIVLVGKGLMGKVFYSLYKNEIVAWVDSDKELKELNIQSDVVIDFSHPSLLNSIISYAKEENVPLVIATTGYSSLQEENIKEAAKFIAVCKDSNFSLGILKIKEIIKSICKDFDGQISLIETHHINKKDAPSGTALSLRDIFKEQEKEIKILSIRKGDEIGKHIIKFTFQNEVIEIKHQVTSKEVFAEGAHNAARKILNKNRGLFTYSEVLNG